MSLTSYRAAPPRDNRSDYLPVASGREGEGLAASYSSAAGAAVPSALRVFTAEFGMGSGVWPLAMATRPAKPAPAEAGGCCHVTSEEVSEWAACPWIGRVLPLHADGLVSGFKRRSSD